MTFLNRIRDHLETLLHPSARGDAMTSARHRAFIAPRLLGSLAALALLPIYLVLRGAPSDVEVIAFAWLIAPILVAYFLSRTGRYESAHILSSVALASMVMALALRTGGITSFAAVWLVVLPLEAALSASRRVIVFAVALALFCVGALVAVGLSGAGPAEIEPGRGIAAEAVGIASATLFAAVLAFAAEWLARAGSRLLVIEEQRYRMLALNMSDIVSSHRRNGAVEFVSPAAESILGVPAGRLRGHGLFDRVHVADRPAYLKALSDAAQGNDSSSVEFRVRRESQQGGAADFVWLEMRCRPLEYAAGSAGGGEPEVVAVMRDVTARRAHDDALQAARVEAERAGAAKTRFLATMSHELRTPLNAIIGFSEMIAREDDLAIDPGQRKEYARLIHDSGQHLLSVVNGILDTSKMEAGSFELALQSFKARDAIVSSCNLLALKARESGVDLRIRLPDDLPEVTADPLAFKRIILNLVSNAIKFTDRDGTVTVSCRGEAGQLRLAVADTGIGISGDDLKRIGEPFFQAGTTYQRRHEGTGLGLSIVKSLVGLHGGDISVSSKIDEGTVVVVTLPLVASPQLRRSTGKVTPLAPVSRPDPSIMQVKKSA